MNCKLDLRFNISISSVEHRKWINSQNRNAQYLIIDQGAVTVRVDLMRVLTCQTTKSQLENCSARVCADTLKTSHEFKHKILLVKKKTVAPLPFFNINLLCP